MKHLKLAMNKITEIKNSTLLKELERRIKLQEIRFDYDSLYEPQNIIGLISWNSLDECSVDFTKLTKLAEKKRQKWEKNQQNSHE